MSKTALVVDDHPLFRNALVKLLEETRLCGAVLCAASAEEGAARLREAGNVDLILLDLALPGVSGIDAVAMLRDQCPAVIVVISASEHRQEIAAATRAGASAVVSKSVSMETLRDVLCDALSGRESEPRWIRPTGTLDLGDAGGRKLTARQQEVAALLMNGHSNKEVGIRLGLAEITVKSHLTAIFRVLGVVNRTQAVVAMRRLGLHNKSDTSASSTNMVAGPQQR